MTDREIVLIADADTARGLDDDLLRSRAGDTLAWRLSDAVAICRSDERSSRGWRSRLVLRPVDEAHRLVRQRICQGGPQTGLVCGSSAAHGEGVVGVRGDLAAVQSVVNRLGDLAARTRSTPGRSVFAVVDVETTGLSPRTNRLVEVAVVGIDVEGRTVDEYVTLLNPGRDVGPTRIHGIRASDVEQAPAFGDIAGHLLTLLAGRVVVGHNVAFDWRFLLAEFDRLGVRVPDVPRLCTMQLARQHLDGLGSRSLASCCQAARVQLRDHHSALADAHAAAMLLAHYRSTGRLPTAWWDQQLAGCARVPWPRVPLDQGPVSVTRAHAAARPADEQLLAHLVAALPDQATGDPDTDTHLAVLDSALEDRRVSPAERQQLTELAVDLGLSAGTVTAAHQR